MKLGDFSGGLSTRLDPTLVAVNEALLYKNIDNTKGNLTSMMGYTTSTIEVSRWLYKFDSVWYSSTVDREYLEYRNKLYWTELDNRPKKIVNGEEKLLGIDAPTSTLVAAVNIVGDIVTGPSTVQYMYTYYDSSEGIESAPSPLSNELAIDVGESVDLSNFEASANPNVDVIRLYRVGAGATDFTLLIEQPISTTTYNDNIKTLDAIGTILDTYDNQAPIEGLRFLTEAYGILFAAKGNTLHYTRIGLPDAWPSTATITIPADITGVYAIPDGLLIFTNSKTYILLSTEPSTFKLVIFNSEHGCVKHNSIKYIRNMLMWVSADGICAMQSASVSVITKDKLDKVTLNVVSATIFNEQYFLVLEDGSAFIADLRYGGLVFKTLEYPLKEIYNLVVFDNTLYGVIEEKLVSVNKGDLLELYYESPRLTEGDASIIKLYNNIYIRASGRFIIDTYIDGIKVASVELVGDDIFDIKVPQEKQRGTDIQFKIQGVGVVKEVEYKVIGRENGR